MKTSTLKFATWLHPMGCDVGVERFFTPALLKREIVSCLREGKAGLVPDHHLV